MVMGFLTPARTTWPGCRLGTPHKAYRSSSTPSLRVPASLDVVAFTFILDDLVYPDGATLMAQPGGGGPQTLFGYQLYAGQQATVGLAAGVGSDLPPTCLQWLADCGVQLEGLLVQESQPTPRAWQVLESDGRRTEVRRCPALCGFIRLEFPTGCPLVIA